MFQTLSRWLQRPVPKQTGGKRSPKTHRRASRLLIEELESRLAPSFSGGAFVATGDINGDGFLDIVTGAGPGGGPHVRAFSGRDGSLLLSFFAFDPKFSGGVSVATGDLNRDGFADVVTGAGSGSVPEVRAFSGKDGSLMASFLAFDPLFSGGVNVAVLAGSADGTSIVVGAGPGGTPDVKVFDATGREMRSVLAFDQAFSGGVGVATGDVNRDGFADIVVGAGAGGGPHIRAFSGQDGSLLQNFFAYDPSFRGGAVVAVGADGAVFTGSGSTGAPHLKVFAPDGSLKQSYFAYVPAFKGGLHVAAGDLDADGIPDIVTGAGERGAPHVKAFSGQNGSLIASFFAYSTLSLPAGFSKHSGTSPTDTHSPIVLISSPTDGVFVSQNVVVSGRVTDDLSGVASIRAQVGSGSFFAVPFNASGDFQFTTNLTLDGTMDGEHTVRLSATDLAGNASTPIEVSFTLDTVAPGGSISSPVSGLITNHNIAINGNALDAGSGVAQVERQVDSEPFVNLPFDSATGLFQFDTTLPLDTSADGSHTVRVRFTDRAGNVFSPAVVSFLLDTTPPAAPTFDLSVTSDTDAIGDQTTTAAIVLLVGHTTPLTSVVLLPSGVATVSDGYGNFQFPGVSLAVGANAVTAQAVDAVGNVNAFSQIIHRLNAAPASDVVLDWNHVLLEAVRLDASSPPVASRNMAMVQGAVYDTVSAIQGTPGYFVQKSSPAGASPDAAVAAAAHRVLSYLYPAQQSTLNAALIASLAQVTDGPGKTDGMALGVSVGDAIIALRIHDGWDTFVDYSPGSGPGAWQPTPPMYMDELLPQWATLQPFAMTSPDQFRPSGPPSLDSSEWAEAYNEVNALGRATGSTRTADQTQIARFWADGSGTYTPPGHWNEIAAQVARQKGNSLAENARLLAALNIAQADAAIVAWDVKYADEFWRPVTAIRAGDTDGNAATTADPNWSSLIITPNFPEYISGHSTFSGAAATILTAFFGDNVGFTTDSIGLPGVQRTFTSFQAAAEEAGRSRIYGGIHYQFSNADGLASGRALANFVLEAFSTASDIQPPKVAITAPPSGITSSQNITISGIVSDNLTGANSLQVSLDGGSFVSLTVDAAGHFVLPTNFALDGTADGVHTFAFQATDHAGNVSAPVPFTFILDTIAPEIITASPTNGGTLASGDRLTGMLSGTGSAVVAFSYQFDGGPAFPLAISDTFDFELDLSRVTTGNHALTLTAEDAAGSISTQTLAVTLAAAIPLTVTETLPANGADDVGSNYRPKITFSRPIDVSTLNANNFFATDTTGAKLSATITPASDGTFAWLFFANPMPGSSTIALTVDGSTIRAADGTPLDAAGTGELGSKLTLHFTTVSLTPLPGTSLTGIVVDPGPDLKPMTFDDVRVGPDAILMTADDNYLLPLSNVKVFILGLEDQAVFTDDQGRFSFAAVPSGNVKLAVDGRTATNAPAGIFFPEMVMDLMLDPGRANTVMGSMGTHDAQLAMDDILGVHLPRLQSDILHDVNPTEVTRIAVTAESAPYLTPEKQRFLTIEIQPGSLIGLDGQPLATGQVGISMVPPEMVREMLPPGLLQHTLDITIQAPGIAAFSTPMPMTAPNLFGAAPGTRLNFLSFDHTTGRLEIEGTGTVSADGLTVSTDPGMGVTHPGWHGWTPPGSETSTTPQNPNAKHVQVNKAKFGDVILVDLKSALPDYTNFSIPNVPSGAGRIAKIPSWDTLLNTTGFFYFAPTFPDSLDRFNRFWSVQLSLTATNPDGDTVAVHVQFKNIGPGHSEMHLQGSVGEGGDNAVLDVMRVQQRLRWLGFRGENNIPVDVSGTGYFNNTLSEAIRLFKAATAAGGSGTPAGQVGRVDVGGLAESWLDASDAPRWIQVPQAFRSSAIGNEIWANSWSIDVISRAGLGRTVTSLSEYPDVAPTIHVEHKAGNDIDWDFDESLVPDEPRFAAETTLAEMQNQLVPSERDLIDRIQRAFSAAGSQFVEVLVGGTGNQKSYARIRQVLDALPGPISNRTVAGHHNHFHVSLKPPMTPGSSLASDVTTTLVHPDPRASFVLELADGSKIRGATNEFGVLNVFLPESMDFVLTVYEVPTSQSAVYRGRTNVSGVPTVLPSLFLDQHGGTDADGDRLPDVGELAIGTIPSKRDTDRDGIIDSAEVAQGLNPLDPRSFPAGVVASVPLLGEPRQVVLAGATADTQGQFAYVATGSYGLAIVEASRFQKPIVLGQLDLDGTATDVSVDFMVGLAAVATGTGLQIVDIRVPMAPRLVRTVNINASRVEVSDGIVYAAVGGTLVSIDLISGAVVETRSFGTNGTIRDIAREGPFLYLTVRNENGTIPNQLQVVQTQGFYFTPRGTRSLTHSAGQIFVGNGIAYTAASTGGFATTDVRDPDHPILLSGSDAPSNSPGVAIVTNGSGRGLLIGQQPIIRLLDTSVPANTYDPIRDISLASVPTSIAIASGIAFLTGPSGLQVVNYIPFDAFGQQPTALLTTSVSDDDPATPGMQILEGTTMPIQVDLTDDVQVRNVEVLVNDLVILNDVSFPFDLVVTAPRAAAGQGEIRLQVRAIDTGGNSILSNPLDFTVIPDTTPPTIVALDPADGSVHYEGFRALQIQFSERMARETLTSNTIRLETISGTVLTPATIQFFDTDREVRLTFDTIPPGDYRLIIDSSSITDWAGNHLGSTPLTTSFAVGAYVHVTNTGDSGPGSLRDAIRSANAATVPILIKFQIPLSDPGAADLDDDHVPDVFVIRPLSPLPALANSTRGIAIDGRTQSAFAGYDLNPHGPEIVLNGEDAGLDASGLQILTDGNQIWGLTIQGFAGHGIAIVGGSETRVSGNYIGTDYYGSGASGNLGSGVHVSAGALRNLIGSDANGIDDAKEGNVIAFNGGYGIAVVDSATVQTTILHNPIHSNTAGQIDLGADGPNTNDLGDTDTGPNGLLNAPDIFFAFTSAQIWMSDVRVGGKFVGLPFTDYRIDYFTTPPGLSGAKTHIASMIVTTDALGRADLLPLLSSNSDVGDYVVATATDPNGNTSELSIAVRVNQGDSWVDTADTLAGAEGLYIGSSLPGEWLTDSRLTVLGRRGVIGDHDITVHPGLDVDIWSVQLAVGNRLTVDIDTTDPAAVDTLLRLFDENGTELAFIENDSAPGEAAGIDPFLDFTAETAGKYYFAISGSGNAFYDPTQDSSGTAGRFGLFSLIATVSIPSEHEPNDTLADALDAGITSPTFSHVTINGSIGDNADRYPRYDVDIYKFHLDAGTRIAVDFEDQFAGGGTFSTLDPNLILFGPDGSPLASSDNDAAPGEETSTESYLEHSVTESGTYYLGVSGAQNAAYDPNLAGSGTEGTTGQYNFVISRLEPNDTLSTAVASGYSSAYHTPVILFGRIGDNPGLDPGLDVDLFEFQLDEGDGVAIDLDAEQPGDDGGVGIESDATLNTYLSIFDASGKLLASNDDGVGPGEFPSADSFMTFLAPSSGTYYLGVSSHANITYDPNHSGSGSIGSIGEYRIKIVRQVIPTEPNDTFASATDTQLSSLNNGTVQFQLLIGDNPSVDPGLDVDFFSVQSNGSDGVTVDLDAESLSGGSSLDSRLVLFDSTGHIIQFDDGSGFDGYLSYSFSSAGIYYIGVSGVGNDAYDPFNAGSGSDGSTGVYVISISLQHYESA